MAFDFESLTRIGGQPQSSSLFTYITEDSLSTVSADGYFPLSVTREGDFIISTCGELTYVLLKTSEGVEVKADWNIGDTGNGFVFVSDKNDFPDPVGGVITLEAEKTYFLTTHVDLEGNRLVGGEDTVMLGASSENASLTSTGIGSDYLFTSDWTTPVRHITFRDVQNCFGFNLLDASTDTNLALDWTGVNFQGCTVNVRCGDIDNFIFDKGAILGSGKFEFFGQFGTVGIGNSLFVGSGADYPMIDIQSTANATRRFRVIYSSFVAFGSTKAINYDVNAQTLNQSYILDFCNFSGGGTYLSGVTNEDNKALFERNVGIDNSADISQYYMNGNSTATTVTQSTPAKVLGATSSASVTSKFTNTDNRATYEGALVKFFKVTATASVSAGNNNQIGLYIAKNGVVLPESEIYGTTNSGGRAENIVIQTLVELENGDYIEIFAENDTSSASITVTDLNVVVE